MNTIVPAIAVLGGLCALLTAAPLAERLRRNLVRAAAGLGWLGVLMGAVGIYLNELTGVSVLLGTAACAGLVIFPAGMKLAPARRFAAAMGGCLPLVLGVLAGVTTGATDAGPEGSLLLYTAQWGTLAAALTAALMAASLSSSEGWTPDATRKTPGIGVGLALGSLPVGAYLLGTLRGGPQGAGWTLPLATPEGDVLWEVPASSALPGGLWIEAVVEVSWMGPMLIAAAAVAVATGVATRFDAGRRASALGWIVSALCSGAGLLGLLTQRGSASLPDAGPYANTARSLLAGVENAGPLVEQGSFNYQGDLMVPLGEIAPEIALLSLTTLLGLVAAAFAIRKDWPGEAGENVRRAAFRLHARDYSLRAVVLGWMSWLLASLIHWSHFGAVGVGSPAEWNAAGILMVMTGVLLVGWRHRKTRADGVVREIAPGVICAILVIGIALSAAFDAPFGLSMVF